LYYRERGNKEGKKKGTEMNARPFGPKEKKAKEQKTKSKERKKKGKGDRV